MIGRIRDRDIRAILDAGRLRGEIEPLAFECQSPFVARKRKRRIGLNEHPLREAHIGREKNERDSERFPDHREMSDHAGLTTAFGRRFERDDRPSDDRSSKWNGRTSVCSARPTFGHSYLAFTREVTYGVLLPWQTETPWMIDHPSSQSKELALASFVTPPLQFFLNYASPSTSFLRHRLHCPDFRMQKEGATDRARHDSRSGHCRRHPT